MSIRKTLTTGEHPDTVKPVSSLVVDSGEATATSTGHGLADGDYVCISGATPAELNGRQGPVTVTDGNTYTFSTKAEDGPATGTVTGVRVDMASCEAPYLLVDPLTNKLIVSIS
jgi:hypothetical protein